MTTKTCQSHEITGDAPDGRPAAFSVYLGMGGTWDVCAECRRDAILGARRERVASPFGHNAVERGRFTRIAAVRS